MNNPLKRLFLAVPLDEENLNLCSEFLRINEDLTVKWVSKINWHITTVFLGDFPDNLIQQLKESLRKVFEGFHDFEIEFDCFCLVPDKKNPRMIWARYKLSESFDTLVYDTFSELKKFYKEHKLEFNISLHKKNTPHVTLSRLKSRQSLELKEPQSSIKLNIKNCLLFESILSSREAQYLMLEDFIF